MTDTGSDSGNRSIIVIKIDPHHSWCHSSQANTHELIWLWPVTTANGENLTEQSKIIVKIKGFDHHKNKNQAVFVAFTVSGKVIFRFGCISKMPFYSKSYCLGGLCNMGSQVP